MDRDKQLVDKMMERLGEKAREFILTSMLMALAALALLTGIFVVTGAMKSWGWL